MSNDPRPTDASQWVIIWVLVGIIVVVALLVGYLLAGSL